MAKRDTVVIPQEVYFLLRYFDENWNELPELALLTRNSDVVRIRLQRWRESFVDNLGTAFRDCVGHGKATCISVELSDGIERQTETRAS